MVLVSACLTGKQCRYNGGGAQSEHAMELLRAGEAVAVCPEELGGLPTPWPPAEIQGGDGYAVLNGCARVAALTGKDVHRRFCKARKRRCACAACMA